MGREEIEGHASVEIEDGSFVESEVDSSDWRNRPLSAWMRDAAPLAFQMSDGGTVEVTHDYQVAPGDKDIIRFVHRYDNFDAWMDRQLTYTNGGTRIVFEVVDGVPGCVSITLKAQDRPIRQKDLTATKLDQIRDEAYQVAGMLVVADENMFTAGPRFIRKALNTSASRRKITPDFLRRVADIYQSSDRTDDVIEAIQNEFPASERQIYRYIATARKKGFITEPPTPPAKKASPTKKASPAKKALAKKASAKKAPAKKAAASGGQHRGKKVLATKAAKSPKPKGKG